MPVRHFVRLLALVFLAGCAFSPQERASHWLGSGGRTIAVSVDHELPNPDYQVHESNVLEGAGEGAVSGASLSLLTGIYSLDPFVLAAGVVLMPVIALGGDAYGAATAEPDVHRYPLEKVEGAATLFEAASQRANLKALLISKIAQRSPTPTGHQLVVVSKEKEIPAFAANMTVKITAYSLIGKLQHNPTVSLLVAGITFIQTPGEESWYSCEWSYNGSKKRLTKWSANSAELFQREVERAAQEITDEILANLEGTGECSDKDSGYSPADYKRIAEEQRKMEAMQMALEKRAVSGDAAAQFALFQLPLSDKERWHWLCLAANQDHAVAQGWMGEQYWLKRRTLRAVEPNPISAYMWFQLAHRNGHEYVSNWLADIRQQMNPNQIAEAERLLVEWRPDPAACKIDFVKTAH